MTLSKHDVFDKLVEERKSKVGNFDLKVQASVLLYKLFLDKGYNFYFCPKIKPVDQTKTDFKTPDFHACKENKNDVLGEIKQSLPNPNCSDYDKKMGKDLKQLKDYKGALMEISTPHDVFFSTPAWCNEAIPKYIEEIEKVPELKEKIVILKYYWMKGDNHNRLSIAKIYGSFSDSDLDSEFKFKEYQSGEGDLEKIQGGYKIIYTEEELNETPIEYIMMILWHNVFPELINSATFDKTLERIKKGENTLEFNIDEIIDVLNKLYVLKSSENITWSQVNRQMIIEAMKGFEKIQKAQKLDDSLTNPKYRIIHSKISTHKSGLIDYLIKELNKEEFTKEANKEYQKTVNKTLTEQ